MTVPPILDRLDRVRRSGSGWVARCPAHQDRSPSLSITEKDGRLLFHCHAGCSQQDVLAKLRALGAWPDRQRLSSPAPPPIWSLATREQIDPALIERLWGEALPQHPRLAAYLRFRGLSGTIPPTLRFHQGLRYTDPDGPIRYFPAMLGRFLDADGQVVGLHRTFLDPRGAGKARVDSPKRFLGRVLGAAVHLGEPAAGRLGVAEGIETALAVQEARGTPMWASGSAVGLARLVLPPGLAVLEAWADPDQAGRGAAGELRRRAEAASVGVELFVRQRSSGGD
ncbi:MAG: toprim domain-containing protein [Candidatus Dormiibacterota bacterium]